MQQVIRKGIKDMIVEEVPDPIAGAHHVLIRPVFSLISSGTETASIHQEGVLKEVADNPSHIGKVLAVMKANGPLPTIREVRAKFSEFAALGYSGAGILVEKHPTVKDLELGDRVAYGGEGTGHAETIVTGRNLVARVPDDVAFEHACFATLGSIALNGVRISGVGLGDRVAVIGLGLVGQLVAQLARLQGAVVIATDLRPSASTWRSRSVCRSRFTAAGPLREQVMAADRRQRRGLCDYCGRGEVFRSLQVGARHLPRPRTNRGHRRRGDGVPLERHVPEGNPALHGACVWSGQL